MASSIISAETELFRRAGAELSLVVAGEESLMMQRGEFVLLLVKHASSPLAAVVAVVGDMQWPVGKDSLVLKHKDNRYSFSLPAALTFAVTFTSPDTVHLQQLDSLLRQYSTFAPRPPPQAGTGLEAHAASEYWTTFASNATWNKDTSQARQDSRDPGSMSPKLAEKMLQARRMSAVQKLFARSVERGAINASTHVTVAAAADASRVAGHEHADASKLAVATVDAVAKVVEAVETAGRTLQDTRDHGEQSKRTNESNDAAGSLKTSAWTLNKMGLSMLFRTITSIQTRSNTSGAAPFIQDTSSDSQSLSSSSTAAAGSSSSISTKLHIGSSPLAADSTAPWQVHVPLQKLSCPPPSHTVENISGTHDVRGGSPFLVAVPQGQSVPQGGAIRPLPLPPRFCGAAMPPPRLMGVIPAGSLAPVVSPGSCIPRTGQPEQTAMASLPPPPPRHPLRLRPRPRPPAPPHNWPV